MRAGLIAILVLVVAAVVVALNSFFIVNPTQQALVLQFGEVRQAIRNPGLNAKIPVVQDVLFLDKRVLDLNIPAQEIIAADQKRLVVDAFLRYRIANPVRFYQTVNNVREGATRLSTFAQSSLRAVLADATFQDIVRDDRPELMLRIRDDVASRARDIGVEVIDVKIRRADLPEANSEAIFARMQTERVQEATQIRAQGREAAQRVRAAADRTATVLRAEAQREAEQIRGQGDGQANAIFADAYSQDEQFFAFFRAMQAYENSIAANDTRLVLSPQSDFFRYFNDPTGAGGYGAATQGAAGTTVPAPAVEEEGDAAAALSPAIGADGQTVAPEDSPAAEAALQNLQEVERATEPTTPDDVTEATAPPAPGTGPEEPLDGTAPVDEVVPAPAAEGAEAATPADSAPTSGEAASDADATPSDDQASAIPAENVDIDSSAEPDRITIVRPDQKAE